MLLDNVSPYEFPINVGIFYADADVHVTDESLWYRHSSMLYCYFWIGKMAELSYCYYRWKFWASSPWQIVMLMCFSASRPQSFMVLSGWILSWSWVACVEICSFFQIYCLFLKRACPHHELVIYNLTTAVMCLNSFCCMPFHYFIVYIYQCIKDSWILFNLVVHMIIWYVYDFCFLHSEIVLKENCQSW